MVCEGRGSVLGVLGVLGSGVVGGKKKQYILLLSMYRC